MVNRRKFITRTAMIGAGALMLPRRAWPFDQSPTNITKFAVTLPGLGPGGANNLGNYISVLTPLFGSNYQIVAKQFRQQVHPNLPPTTFFGYADATTVDSRYLGGVIVAKRGTPVNLKVTNHLPPLHILPVDTTLVDPIMSAEVGGRMDRIAVHIHGGAVTWPNDGGPFHWFSNANNPGGFVHGSSFVPNSTPGSFVYNYPNDQSARLLWYHDHAYSITRVNAYSGIATGYLVTDDAELQLIASGVLPQIGDINGGLYTFGIPLIVQDKTFWKGPGGTDPNYASVVPAGAKRGSLWYPHVYEGASAENLPAMSLPPACGTGTARWELNGGTPPPISTVPEFFSDTVLVNGAPYPVLNVPPRRLRFRFLNGSQARFYNLQLYVADGSIDGITLAPHGGDIDNNGNPILAPTNPAGPAFIQVGNEAGFLPAPALFSNGVDNHNSNRVIGYKLVGSGPGDPTVGNVNRYNLLIAPAERPDVIIDFRGFEGSSVILYNDAPAPFPGGDIRNDYYAGDFDLTCIDGAPATRPGFGPDTRILMKFVVGNSGGISELSFNDTITTLQSALPIYFADNQPPSPNPKGPAKIKSLNEHFDVYGRLIQQLGAPAVSTYLDTPVDFANAGESQQWQIFNFTGDTHPMHFHLVNVQVVSRAAWKFDSSGSPLNGKLAVIPDSVRPPDANEMGYRETVRINPGEVVTVNMTFNMPPGAPSSPRLQSMYGINGAEYVWHCHILEHEEHDMMHALVVTGGTT